MAPWTAFWEHNIFVVARSVSAAVLLSPWFRGAVSGIGVVTFAAGVVDLFGLFLRREPSGPQSAGAPH